MRKWFSKNEKGSVLLTVICFTTMCLILAAAALHAANASNAKSTENVMKAQAQVTAERYLQQYLSTFPTVTGADGQPRTNYDLLKSLAGASKDSPRVVTISLQPQIGSLSSVGITSGTLEQTALYGGNAHIEIYKEGSKGFVVRCDANYNGQTGVASAYFYGETPSVDLNKNAIETCGSYEVYRGATVMGDILIENNEVTDVNFFKNSTGGYYSNFYTNTNLTHDTEDVVFADTVQNNAPTITVGGYLFAYQLQIGTDVGKTDANGKKAADTGYDLTHLLNKNGYINCFQKVIFSLQEGANKIGYSAAKPIDVYSKGIVIGKIPSTAYGSRSATAVADFRKNVVDTFKGCGVSKLANDNNYNSTGEGLKFYGNVYCRKASDEMSANGDFYYYNTNGKKTIIYGDLVVEGELVLEGWCELQVMGKVYVKDGWGSVYVGSNCKLTDKDGNNITAATINANKNAMPSDDRSITPDRAYAPGLYIYGVKDNPSICMPSSYRTKSPNQMYAKNDNSSKFFKDNFNIAISRGLGDTGVSPDYINQDHDKSLMVAEASSNNSITIKKSCMLTVAQACAANNITTGGGTLSNGKTYGGGTGDRGINYTVDVQNEDIWIALPVTSQEIKARFFVNNPGTKHHCYFVFYEPSAVTTYGATYGTTPEEIAKRGKVKTVNQINAAKYYTVDVTATPSPYTTAPKIIWSPLSGQNPRGGIWSTGYLDDFNDRTINDRHNTANSVVLIPDGFYFDLGGGSTESYWNTVFYGPRASFEGHVNKGNFTLTGQVKVGTYITDEQSGNPHSVNFGDLEESSILHSFLTQGNMDAGSINFQYFIKAK